MKLMDENGRLFGRVSVIDVLAILVVLFMAVALFTTSRTRTTATGEEETITFQIRVQGVEGYMLDAIRVRDSLYDQGYASGGKGIGTITAVEVERDPGTQLSGPFADGGVYWVESEGTLDLILTVEGRGTRDGRSCTLNGVYALGVNASRTYYTNRAIFSGKVIDVFD